MANAAVSVSARDDEEAKADVSAANECEEGGELIPTAAQLTAAIDPTLFSSITSLHGRWAAHLANHAPSLSLSSPASATDLHALSAYIASQQPPASPTSPPIDSPSHNSPSLASLSCLPADVLSLWLHSDGEGWSSDGGGVLGNFSLLSARQSLREYITLCELLDNRLLASPTSPLAPRFTRSYFPIAASPASHYLLAPLPPTDRSPRPTPPPPPLLLLPSDGTRAWRVAPSLHALLGRVVDGLDGGRWRWDDGRKEWTGERAEGFCGAWDEGGGEWDSRQDSAVRQYDESVLAGLTRDIGM